MISRPQWMPLRFGCSEYFLARSSASAFLLTLLLALAFSGLAHADNGHYTIRVDLPPQIIEDVVLSINLPSGLIFEPETATVSGALSTAQMQMSSANDGREELQVSWNFGQVNNLANQDLLIEFRALMADVSNNQDGRVLNSKEVILKWKESSGIAHESFAKTHPVKVIEPALILQRDFNLVMAQPGDIITCTLVLQPSAENHADAYNVDVTETLPEGLIYSPNSIQMLSGQGWKDESNGKTLHWHLDEVKNQESNAEVITLSYKAMVARSASKKKQLISQATLSWYSAAANDPQSRYYSTELDGIIAILHKPILGLTLADYPDPVHQNSPLTYTISYRNTGGNATGAKIYVTYDSSLAFVSANPAPDLESEKSWSLGSLLENSSGNIILNLLTNATTPDGTVLLGSATFSTADGTSIMDSVTTAVKRSSPSLLIDKTASKEIIRPGDIMNYTISYRNSGNDAATNVTVTDVVDKNLIFDPILGATPKPSRIWQDDEGTHLYWNKTALRSETIGPDDRGTIELQVMLPAQPEHPSIDKVYDLYKIDCTESQGDFKTVETFVVHSLFVRKSAEKKMYSAGEGIVYTIYYGNELAVDAENAVVTDILPAVDYRDADPIPTLVKGNILTWNLGSLPAKSNGKILLLVQIKENKSEVGFRSRESVSGHGFVRFDSRMDTAENPNTLTNYVNITATYLGLPDSDDSSATVMLADALGTATKVQGHGSGSYRREEETSLIGKNKSIQIKTSLSEKYAPTSFSLPKGRAINYSSKWSEAQEARNRVTGTSVVERYMYANRIDRESSLSMDKNGTTLVSETSFEGSGHIGTRKNADGNQSVKSTPVYESQEDYTGSFKVLTRFDEYGKNVQSSRYVTGLGSAASDKRIGKSQRSHESGTGRYQAEDLVQTKTNYLAKNINVTHEAVNFTYTPDFSVNLSLKWDEYMWSRSGESSQKIKSSKPSSFIREVFTLADSLNKSTVVRGLNEMSTEAKFQGSAQFLAAKMTTPANGVLEEKIIYNEYIGRYNITRNIRIGGVARFGEPHISVSKVSKSDPDASTFVDYAITVTNDGNHALGPVRIIDLFPPDTEYVYSSARPAEQNQSRAEWTLLNLGIGMSSTIELKLNRTGESDNLVNRVLVMGNYEDKWITANNYSAIQSDWLTCCPSQLQARKIASIDAKDPMVVHYRIILKNRENYTMAATVIDQLPQGLNIQSSSIVPNDWSAGRITWNLIDILPDETRIIDYQARAEQGGIFVSRAHIEAYFIDGENSVIADIASSVEIKGQDNPDSRSCWQAPVCFGLNCFQQNLGPDWVPCYSCGAGESEQRFQDSEF